MPFNVQATISQDETQRAATDLSFFYKNVD